MVSATNHKVLERLYQISSKIFEINGIIEKMPGKETIYYTKSQLQRLCELYRFEDNLWNASSSGYHKTDKKNASLDRIRETMMEEFQDIQPFTGNCLLC